MKQRTLNKPLVQGLHVAIIMDGNGRWAEARGLPRLEGHRRGAEAVRRTVEAAPELGIGTLTLYAFSCDNWKRPAGEVGGLMHLFRKYLETEAVRCAEHGVRVEVIGRRNRLEPALRSAIEHTEEATVAGTSLHLRIAVDYSVRDAILRAARKVRRAASITRETFARALAEVIHTAESVPEVDLLVRTGGEQRVSDLLGWDSAYAELFFTDTMWPEFDAADLRAAMVDFWGRERRFGGLPPVEFQPAGPLQPVAADGPSAAAGSG